MDDEAFVRHTRGACLFCLPDCYSGEEDLPIPNLGTSVTILYVVDAHYQHLVIATMFLKVTFRSVRVDSLVSGRVTRSPAATAMRTLSIIR